MTKQLYQHAAREREDLKSITTSYIGRVLAERANPEGIADKFVSYFSKACSSNTAAGALRLRQTYENMRASYVGLDTGIAHRFDAELIENVICNKMRMGKAADLDGITVAVSYTHLTLPTNREV